MRIDIRIQIDDIHMNVMKFLWLFHLSQNNNKSLSIWMNKPNLIDKTISIEEKRIELLKEYRQSLISEVVTGKRKVVE